MHETPHATFHLDSAPPPAHAGAAALWHGWALGRAGNFLSDLRVRIGQRICPAVFGLPRPDLAAFFGEPRPFLLAGFEVQVTAAAGDSTAVIEACEAGAGWVPLTEVPLRSIAPAPGAEGPAPRPVYHPHEFARALRLVLQRGVARPFGDTARELVAELPFPSVVRYPALPFHGHLHQPALLERAVFGRLIVEGWLFHETARIRRIAASVDLQAWSILDYGAPLPYVAGLFPQHAHAHASRLSGFIDVPANLPQPLSVRLYAELEDGSWHLCHVQRNCIYDGETNKLPYGRLSVLRLAAAARALRTAAQARGFAMPLDRGWLRALREVWSEYRSRADRGIYRESTAPAAPTGAPLPGCVTLVSHNLNREGAPLFLLEYARHLASRGVALTVLSGAEGPLRADFAQLGARVQAVDPSPLFKAATERDWRAALDHLATQADLGDSQLVVANTISAHWGVHLAHRAGRPSLLYIHESTTPDAFYHGHLPPALLPAVKETFSLANHVSFLTETTRRYYRPVLTRANHSLNPGWIDVARLRAFFAGQSRATLRAELGFAPDRRIIANVGTVCDRKGQHLFARAVDLLWRRAPTLAAQCDFLIVGGRNTPFDRVVLDLVAQLGRPNLHVVPETSEPQRYFGAADLFVCSSYEESFPRVVLEAMVAGTPIVSTGVHGIPEIVRPGREALLVPPGDVPALATAMIELLSDTELAHRLAGAAATRVAAEFDSALLLPRHAALAAAILLAARK